MKITDICTQKNNPLKVSVFVDDKYAFSLDKDDPLVLKIKKDMEISKKDFNNFSIESEFSKAKKYAFDIISLKAYSKKELLDKLLKKGFDKTVSYETVNELEDLGYLNDQEYANLYISYAKEKLWGKEKVKYELSKKGIKQEIINECLLDLDNNDLLYEILNLIKTKYKGEDFSNHKTRAKITRFILQRGFNFDFANKCINHLTKEAYDE